MGPKKTETKTRLISKTQMKELIAYKFSRNNLKISNLRSWRFPMKNLNQIYMLASRCLVIIQNNYFRKLKVNQKLKNIRLFYHLSYLSTSKQPKLSTLCRLNRLILWCKEFRITSRRPNLTLTKLPQITVSWFSQPVSAKENACLVI